MCFFRHKYTRWKDIEKGEISRGTEGKRVIGNFVVQERVCEDCGRKELRTVKTYVSQYHE